MRALRLVPVGVLVLLALTACDPGTTPPTESPKPVETLAPSETPTPTPDPVAEAPTCQNIISPAAYTAATSGFLSITDPGQFHDKLVSEGNPLSVFFDAGGILCQVGNSSEATDIYGYAVLSAAQFAPVRDSFVAEGYMEIEGDLGVGYEVPDGAEGQPRNCYFRVDEFTVCGTDDSIVDVMDTLGLS